MWQISLAHSLFGNDKNVFEINRQYNSCLIIRDLGRDIRGHGVALSVYAQSPFGIIFSGTPYSTIFSALKYAPRRLYLAYLGAHLSGPHIVKWGIPEKILQNAVQTRWS